MGGRRDEKEYRQGGGGGQTLNAINKRHSVFGVTVSITLLRGAHRRIRPEAALRRAPPRLVLPLVHSVPPFLWRRQ